MRIKNHCTRTIDRHLGDIILVSILYNIIYYAIYSDEYVYDYMIIYESYQLVEDFVQEHLIIKSKKSQSLQIEVPQSRGLTIHFCTVIPCALDGRDSVWTCGRNIQMSYDSPI